MKFLLYISLFLTSFSVAANNGVEKIKAAIKSGNSEALAQFFDKKVEICVFDTEDIYPDHKGKQIIQDFFAKHKPQSLTQLHKGNSRSNNAQYLTGTMKDTTGNTFRVYIYLKQVGEQLLIQEIRFDQD